jgi:hypothetical protein
MALNDGQTDADEIPLSALCSGTDEIRLVAILPPSLTEEDEISCSLTHVPLRDAQSMKPRPTRGQMKKGTLH